MLRHFSRLISLRSKSNRFTGIMAEKSFWSERWETDKIGWHREEINGHLKNHYVKSEKGIFENCVFQKFYERISVLVPLCGKTKDLLWLAEQGCQVIGVEFAEKACEDFFNENKLEFEVSNSVFTAKDKPIKIYCGDFYTCEITEKVSQSHKPYSSEPSF